MREILYAEALVETLRLLLESDDRVHLIGQYFLGLTPHRQLIAELEAEFPGRVYHPPIAELGYVGTAIGAAVAGLRPIVDLATSSFMFQGFAQIVNEDLSRKVLVAFQSPVISDCLSNATSRFSVDQGIAFMNKLADGLSVCHSQDEENLTTSRTASTT